MARPSSLIFKDNKFNKEVELLFEKLKKGRPAKMACALAKIPYGNVKEWKLRGDKLINNNIITTNEEDLKYIEFSERYACACAEYDEKLIDVRNDYMFTDNGDRDKAKEAMTELKARHPDEWSESRINKIEAKDNSQEAITIITEVRK